MIGGEQLLSLGEGCELMGIVAHEFAHALGIDHTQSRSDRNTYVDVDTSDVKTGMAGIFYQRKSNENFLYTPYDYGSVMHYGANAFTNKLDSFSVVPKDINYIYTIGNRLISFYDIQMINFFYNCMGTCTKANSAVCQNEGYPNPRNCAECNCPLGYGGTLCDQRPAGCGESLSASPDWQKKEFTFGDENNKDIRDVLTMCNHWITAPQGKKIQVRITNMFNEQCNYGCSFNGIEIKADARKEILLHRKDQIVESKLNPTPVVSFNRFGYTTFEIEYRYVDDNVATTVNSPTTTTMTTTTTIAAAATTIAPVNPNAAITITTKKTTTTTTPDPPVVWFNMLTFSQFPLMRLYNHALLRHLFQYKRFEIDLWVSIGYRIEGEIGKVIDADVYFTHKAELDALCPSLVKLRTFFSKVGTEFMTTDNAQAQWRLNNGWKEGRSAGYCSYRQACGANKNLRLVSAHNGGNMIFSTDSNELGTLNWKNPRYVGTLSNTICWLF